MAISDILILAALATFGPLVLPVLWLACIGLFVYAYRGTHDL